jgi:hypothetical protein
MLVPKRLRDCLKCDNAVFMRAEKCERRVYGSKKKDGSDALFLKTFGLIMLLVLEIASLRVSGSQLC